MEHRKSEKKSFIYLLGCIWLLKDAEGEINLLCYIDFMDSLFGKIILRGISKGDYLITVECLVLF